MPPSPQHLFVYGTLLRRARHPMHTLLARHAQFLSPATFQGRLFLVSTYPAAIPSPSPRDTVHGELYHLPQPDPLLPQLDDYEDFHPHSPETSLFLRQPATITLPDYSTLTA